MFSKVYKAGEQRAWRQVLVLVAAVFFAISAVTEPFSAKAMETSGFSNNSSSVSSVAPGPVSHTSIEVDCSKTSIAGHSASSHCTATLPGGFTSGASIERLGFVCCPTDSLKIADKKPPHGPPKPISLS